MNRNTPTAEMVAELRQRADHYEARWLLAVADRLELLDKLLTNVATEGEVVDQSKAAYDVMAAQHDDAITNRNRT